MVESWCGFCTLLSTSGTSPEGLRGIFGEFSDIVENDILTMQRFLDVSRFLYCGGWQVCGWQLQWCHWLWCRVALRFPSNITSIGCNERLICLFPEKIYIRSEHMFSIILRLSRNYKLSHRGTCARVHALRMRKVDYVWILLMHIMDLRPGYFVEHWRAT